MSAEIKTKTKKEVKAAVRKQFSKSGKLLRAEDSEETLEVHEFITEPVLLRVGFGVTENLGDFESVRVDISLTVPCYKEELEDAAKFAEEWVATRVMKDKDEVKEQFASKTPLF